ncbi:MAG: hypothetical protein COB98_00745 [Flavobacteriaceae bacterium]|nr:MAG: hypothetical protein COB98_00745 [Flavobacteriaceae bacterium]
MGFQLEWDNNDANIKFYGILVLQDLMDANGLIYGDGRFDEMCVQIADFTDVERVDLSSKDAKIITTLEEGASRWNRVVKVIHVTTNLKLKTLLTLYKEGMKGTNWIIEVVDTLEEAKK